MTSKARILILDLETAPIEAYAWGLRDVNIPNEMIKHNGYVLLWCAKWLGDKEVMSDAIIDHPSTFTNNRRDDKQIAKSLQKVMDQADVIIGQNSDNFDIKWAQQLFLKHDIPKPSKFYSIDLLKESRAQYYSPSHKLDFRGQELGIGRKMPHEGFRLWLACMRGEKASFKRMRAYCSQDVRLTERYYLKLRPRMKNHPNVNMFHRDEPFTGRLKCPACSSSDIKRNGYNFYSVGKRQRYKCNGCGYRMSLGGKIDGTTKVVFRQE